MRFVLLIPHPSSLFTRLSAVKFDDEVLFERRINLFTRRQVQDAAGQLLGVDVEPAGSAGALEFLFQFGKVGTRTAALRDGDYVAGFDHVGRDADFFAGDGEMTV